MPLVPVLGTLLAIPVLGEIPPRSSWPASSRSAWGWRWPPRRGAADGAPRLRRGATNEWGLGAMSEPMRINRSIAPGAVADPSLHGLGELALADAAACARPGLHAHCTSGSVVMCSTRARDRPALVLPGSFSARQRSASDRPPSPCCAARDRQWGAPGTRPSAVLAVWWQVEHGARACRRSSGPRADQHAMPVPVVGLAREVPARMTVQAARMPQHLGDPPEGLERCLALRGRRGRGVRRPRAGQPATATQAAPRRRLVASLAPQLAQADSKPWLVSGSERMRRPVSANRALQTAAAISGVPGSPMPEGGSVLGTMCTSTSGIASMRSTG